ncbi:hypothetical protein RT717_04675 [Imperialibacter roseus]|uniref:Uncharacterized protein n=1 Tax=Imperialibacter roseus TaxID=1324217 RepID=A0ABZ0ISB0_9BACT|nr:hypothetical protein [Imperialibacter roseus]WOK07922.1 hypothetical protein RT717_04675 [Imperialibacter roseus]
MKGIIAYHVVTGVEAGGRQRMNSHKRTLATWLGLLAMYTPV